MKKVIWWVFISLFFVSCSNETQTIMPTLSATSLGSPLPVNTISNKLLITPTISNTPHPVPAKTLTSTPDPVYLTEEAAVSSCTPKERSWYSKHLSATYFVNGKWGVVVCSDNGIYTKVANETLNVVWEIPATYDSSNNSEPSWYWLPFLWSSDGRYLYMKPVCLCFIDSPWLIYSSGYGLARLSLETGEFGVWLKPSDVGYSFEFSHDETFFAFSPPDLSDVIKIRNLISGYVQNLSFKEKYIILEYRWTSDNSRLIIFTEEHENNPSESGFSVFVYNVKNDVLKKLVDRDNLNYSFPTENDSFPRMYISDLTDDILTLSQIFDENTFQVNIRTGELVQIQK